MWREARAVPVNDHGPKNAAAARTSGETRSTARQEATMTDLSFDIILALIAFIAGLFASPKGPRGGGACPRCGV